MCWRIFHCKFTSAVFFDYTDKWRSFAPEQSRVRLADSSRVDIGSVNEAACAICGLILVSNRMQPEFNIGAADKSRLPALRARPERAPPSIAPDDRLMSVPITTSGSAIEAGNPVALFTLPPQSGLRRFQ